MIATESATAADVVRGDLAQMAAALRPELDLLAGKRLLVTGGAGFLGYYLVQLPLYHNEHGTPDRRIHVEVWDNYRRGVPAWLEVLQDRLTLRRHDVTEALPETMPRFDYVVHAAGIASPPYYRRYPLETIDANVGGLRALLDWAGRRADSGDPIDGLLYFSTSEIYGNPTPDAIPTPETYRGLVSCTGPRACYDESKRMGETLCVTFADRYGVPVRTARPFNNYGPGLKISDRRVLPDFARDVLAGRDIELLSDGAPTRTFCYVADAVVGYFKILTVGRSGEAYNIGVETPEISMADFADRVAETGRELFGYAGRVRRGTAQEAEYLTDNPMRRCPDISKARRELRYEPEVTLEDGLRRSLLWYAGNPVAEDA